MNIKSPFVLVIGQDWCPKADLQLIDAVNGDAKNKPSTPLPKVSTIGWRHCVGYPEGRAGLCLEQPDYDLIPFLETCSRIPLYPVIPITLQKFREALLTS